MADLWFAEALLPTGWASDVRVSIAGSRIERVDTGVPVLTGDERHAIGLPGLCNVHSHGFQRGMAGLSERRGDNGRDNFWSWREVMYRFLDRLDPDDVETITAQAYVEMLETGFTRVGEFHYLHNAPNGARYDDPAEMAGRIVAAAEASGIGLTLLPVFYAHSDFGGVAPESRQRRFLSDLDSFARLVEASAALLPDDAVLGVAPHSLRAVTGEELSALTAGAKGPIHIHAAEQVREVEASLAFSGARPVEWLFDNADVDQRWCLIHATHMTERETDRLAASGAVAGLCPITEANLGDGVFPAVHHVGEGGRLGIGTDSNVLIDAAQELRALEYGQRLTNRARNCLADAGQPSTGRRLFDAALAGGAQALGASHGIVAGAAADIFTLDREHVAFHAREGDLLLDAWIFAARHSRIDTVWRAGRKLVSGGLHLAATPIADRYRRVLRKILD